MESGSAQSPGLCRHLHLVGTGPWGCFPAEECRATGSWPCPHPHCQLRAGHSPPASGGPAQPREKTTVTVGVHSGRQRERDPGHSFPQLRAASQRGQTDRWRELEPPRGEDAAAARPGGLRASPSRLADTGEISGA